MVDAKKFRDTYKPNQGVVIGPVYRHLMRQAGQEDPDRDMGYLHPSEMAKSDWCPRRAYFRISGAPAVDKEQSTSAQLENIYSEGHYIHKKWQTWLWECGLLWGKWECKDCGRIWYDLSPDHCACGGPPRYKEVPLYSNEYKMIGHSDGGIVADEGKFLLEAKSIGLGTVRIEAPGLHRAYAAGDLTLENLWREIKRPFSSHILQGLLYLFMVRDCHPFLADVDEIIFLYEWKPTQAVKEFRVKYNERLIKELLADAKDVVYSLRSKGIEPSFPSWADAPGGKICKACPYENVCWSIDGAEHDPAPTPTPRIRKAKSGQRKRALGTARG